MDVGRIFHDLESNQTQECEESKRKLVELFTQNKETWPVQYMMDYFHKTGSQRIMEVLVKVQPPHDGYIFDRLAEWLKMQTHKLQALNLFCFVVRNNPTWLFKVERHRLIKDIFKLLLIEKEIVPLMSALLCIITLLPIIPNLVPNFFGDLFDVFGRLASWNCQNPNQLPDDKLLHLQLGLQMLFHRLYGMYPCNFLAFLSDFVKKEKGAIFHHTINPLLETVRVHPMLVTATAETEVSLTRWKEKEPHDVVEECAKLLLPMLHQEICDDHIQRSEESSYEIDGGRSSNSGAVYKYNSAYNTYVYFKDQKQPQTRQQRQQPQIRSVPLWRLDCDLTKSGISVIWSPSNEIAGSGAMPLTPTPTYMMPLSATGASIGNINTQLLGSTGSSPPEAAVEATPETTPMKDVKELKQQHSSLKGTSALPNPNAVRAIFASQPSSPMRKEKHTQFSFYDAPTDGSMVTTSTFIEQEVNTRVVTCVSTTYDRRLQQIVHDRNRSQSPFQTIEALTAKQAGFRSPNTINSKSATPELDASDISSSSHILNSVGPTPAVTPSTPNILLTPTPTPIHTPTPTSNEHITKVCDDCNETDRSMCTEGGLQIPTTRSMQCFLVKGLKRRNRMTSYCYDSTLLKMDSNRMDAGDNGANVEAVKVRRTKSCSAIHLSTSMSASKLRSDSTDDEGTAESISNAKHKLQKSNKMLAIASATKKKTDTSPASPLTASAATQTSETSENVLQSYENSLLQMLLESIKIRYVNERNQLYPQEILDQYITHVIRSKESYDAGNRLDHEQFQLLCLQLQYERYRREMHAERNRRLMGRSRDKRSLEMERDQLREQVKSITKKNTELVQQIDKNIKISNEREHLYTEELTQFQKKYQQELEQNKCLRNANEILEMRLNEELANRKDINYELESLRGQIFNLTSELHHAHLQVDVGLQCKQELTRLEEEFIVMGEVQIKCRDRLAELDNFRARDEELKILQSNYNLELKELRHSLEEKSSQLDSAKHKIVELQAQLQNGEKVITEQKRVLKTVKDEYEEQLKSLDKKYDVQKCILMQMEEKIMMSNCKPTGGAFLTAYSPDTDKTDVASSMDRNSPLSTSLASSESLSASLRSTELRNLQQLVETPISEAGGSVISVVGVRSDANIIDGKRLPAPDLAVSASTATVAAGAGAINIIASTSTAEAAVATTSGKIHKYELVGTSTTHTHPHVYLQHQQ